VEDDEEEAARGDLRLALKVRGGAWPVLNMISSCAEWSITRGSNINGALCVGSDQGMSKKEHREEKTHMMY